MTTLELGVVGFTCLMLLGCIGVLFKLHLCWKHIYQREAQRNQDFEKCCKELEMLASGNMGIGRHVARIGRDMNSLREKVERLDQIRVEPVAYDQVARLAGQGTDIKDLVSVFGISEAEAELVMKLNTDSEKIRGSLSTTTH